MKKFTFKGVLDGFRQSVQPQVIRQEQEIPESLKPEHFTLKKTFRHGFPYCPTAFAFDPVQKLIAIGDKSGHIRILGRPGVDAYAKHEGESECAVMLAEFLINEGGLITVTADDTMHLWSIRQKIPEVIQSLKFQRERITCFHLPTGSKWLYVGTEKGNVHVVQVATFALSGYVINWNKAIEVVRVNHPGAVIALCDNPIDANKLLIAFESGLLVLWDLKGKSADARWQSPEPVKSVAWHYEGKYFVSSHMDGSICSWPTKPTPKPLSITYPHLKTMKDGNADKCKPIYKVDLRTSENGETFTIFCGGMPVEKDSKSNFITVMVGKSTTVLEMEHEVIDFITLCENPWACETQEPYAIAVLLKYDLVLIDLLSPGFPCFDSPYPMDLHESPVTCCTYLTDCPSDLVPALYSVGRTTTIKKSTFSDKEWPIAGGEWSPASCSYSEIIITGHQDGSLKFWDSGAGTLQILYKLKTSKIFEKPMNVSTDSAIENPLSIQLLHLCPESRKLCVAGATGQVILFKFQKVECISEVLVLEIPIVYENFDEMFKTSPECDFVSPRKTDSSESNKSDFPVRVKCGPQRKPPGFQSQMVCLTTGPNGRPTQVTSLCMNSSYGLMAYGTEYGLVIIDTVRKSCILNMASPDLYGPHDPFSRTPKSPKRIENKDDAGRSPSSDQLQYATSPDSPPVEFIPEVIGAKAANVGQSQTSRPTSPKSENNVSPTHEPSNKEYQDRRKSMSWKTFNLKRQLSKVNMRIVAYGNSESDNNKGNSTFYTQKESSPEEYDLSPKDTTAGAEEPPNDDFKERQEANDPSKIVSQALQSLRCESEEGDEFGQLSEIDPMKEANTEVSDISSSRPSDLPLGTGKSLEIRDQRLLSVPNIKYLPRDLRNPKNRVEQPSTSSGFTTKKSQKMDNSFSRSRSSSISSIDVSSCESVTYCVFMETLIKKNDIFSVAPTLWIGTSFGSVLGVQITIPEKDFRKSEAILITFNGGPILRLKGPITFISFLDALGSIIPCPYEPWRDERESKKDKPPLKSSNRTSPTYMQTSSSSLASSGGNSTANSSGVTNNLASSIDAITERHYIVVSSEKQTKVFDILNQTCANRLQLPESDFIVKAETIGMKDGSCLAAYLSNGHLIVHSLPSLRILLDVDFLPLMDLSFQTKCKQGIVDPMLSIWGQQIIVHEDTTQISKIFCFSHRGHGFYLASPTEIQKFTISSEFCQFIPEMMGDLYIPKEMPEQPKEGFFKGLFGGGTKNLDREELFGEQSGKANKSIAKHIPVSNIEQLNQRASTAASEISRAHQLAMERGEKLNLLEERAERMSNQAQEFSGTAHQLMLKYKDKKWYQL